MVDSHHEGQWRGALLFSLICAWTNGLSKQTKCRWFRRIRAHYVVTIMCVLRWHSCFVLSLSAAGPCDSSPCQNGALCISRQYSYWEFYLCRCQPPGEYFGRHCETSKLSNEEKYICLIMSYFSHFTVICIDYFPNKWCHDNVFKWKHFPRYWPYVRGIHRSLISVYSPPKRHRRGALMFSLICAWINGWINNREAGDLRRYRAHYDVTVMEASDVTKSIWYQIWLWRFLTNISLNIAYHI